MKLTDDEVVALAVRDGQAWPTPLPTVDLSSQADVDAAARRGERSLYARDLLAVSEDEPLGRLDDALADLLAPVRRRDVVVALFAADDDQGWHAGGPNLLCYRTGAPGRLLLETVSEAGVHVFAATDADVALGSCAELASAAWAGGVRLPDADVATESLCLSRPVGDGTETLQVWQGRAVLHGAAGPVDRGLPDVERWTGSLA